MGPLMIDVQGTSLTSEDKEILAHPLVGGFILFTRNYESPEQITALTTAIRQAAREDILIAVDHEGGRVQRFRDKFSLLPAMGEINQLFPHDPNKAIELAQHCGCLMALEVQAVGIDISFAPVLDINGVSDVIGDRSFHQQPDMVVKLAQAFIKGMHQAGMQATGKHFPGHGSVKEDSHYALPIDMRDKKDIFELDLMPFKHLIKNNALAALMPAHVIFPDVDSRAVGFSPYWLKNILREELSFDGVIFSDDLSMEGAASIGGYIERAEAAQEAGCDMLLTCNNREGVISVLDNANIVINKTSNARLKRLFKTTNRTWSDLSKLAMWQESQRFITQHCP